MMRWMILLLVAGMFAAPMMGCEAKVDEDEAKIKVDTD